MIVDRRIVIDAAAAETFERVIDIPFVGECLPGVSDVREEGDGAHSGNFVVKVGPVKVSLDGTVSIVERDTETRRAVLQMKGSDKRIGGEVIGRMDLAVEESGADASVLIVHTEFTISGKLGQFGQAVMLKKADQITEGFVDEFSRRMTEPQGLAEADPAYDAMRSPEPIATSGDVARSTSPSLPDRVALTLPNAANSMELLHDVLGLLRRNRRFVLISSRECLTGKSAPSEPAWITQDAVRSGVRGGDVAGAPAYVIEARLGRSSDVSSFWRDVTRASLDGAAAIALTPMGSSVVDSSALAELGAELAAHTGRPVLVVATTPWSLFAVARVAQTGVVHGIVADTGVLPAKGTTRLMCLAVAEIRRAGLESPLVAGPSASAGDDKALRAAGADAVIRRPKSRFMAKRVAASRR